MPALGTCIQQDPSRIPAGSQPGGSLELPRHQQDPGQAPRVRDIGRAMGACPGQAAGCGCSEAGVWVLCNCPVCVWVQRSQVWETSWQECRASCAHGTLNFVFLLEKQSSEVQAVVRRGVLGSPQGSVHWDWVTPNTQGS